RRAAAGVSQHAAGAAHADDHPVPGHLARVCDRRLRPAEGIRSRRAQHEPADRSLSARGRAVLRHLLFALLGGEAPAAAPRHRPLKDSPMAAMIEIRDVSKWYGSFQVLRDCTTSVAKGEVVVVCGPSGSGKSTLIKCVNALEPFQQGEIRVDGISVGAPGTDLPRLRARVGMVFQHFELFPHLTVTQN